MGGRAEGGHRSLFFLHFCFLKVCSTHSPYLPTLFPLPRLPLGFSGVVHGIVIVVSVEVGRVVGKREVRALSMVSTGGFNGSGLGEHVFFPSSFLSSQVMKGSAQASEHPQMLWSLQVDIE